MSTPEPTSPGPLTPMASSPAPVPISRTMPTVSIPRSLPQIGASQLLPNGSQTGISQLPLSGQTGTSQLPLSGKTQLPPIGTGSILPKITIPQLAGFGTKGKQISRRLADNEIGDLPWNLPDPPHPVSTSSLYRRIGCSADGHCLFHALAKGLSNIYKLSYKEFKQVDEKTLREFEKSVYSELRFSDNLFDRPRIPDPATVYTIRAPPRFRDDMRPTFTSLMHKYRLLYVKFFRDEFAACIRKDSKMSSLIKKYLSGRIESIAHEEDTYDWIQQSNNPNQTSFELVKEQLITELNSAKYVKPDLLLLFSEYFSVDIYLLRDKHLIEEESKSCPLFGGSSIHEAVLGTDSSRSAIVIISQGDNHYEIVGRVDQTTTEQKVVRTNETRFNQDEPLIRRLFGILKSLRK